MRERIAGKLAAAREDIEAYAHAKSMERDARAARRPRRLPDPRAARSTGAPLVYLDSAATSQKPRGGDRRDGRALPPATTPTSTAASTRSPRRPTRPVRGRARARRRVRRRASRRRRSSPSNATEAINLVAYAWGREQRRRRRRRADHADGAPLQHRALAAALPGARRRAALPRGRRRRRALARRSSTRSSRAATSSSSPSRTSRTCSARSTRSPRSPRACAPPARSRSSTARRRVPQMPVDVARARRRLLRLDRAQGARPDRRSACCTGAASCSRRCAPFLDAAAT